MVWKTGHLYFKGTSPKDTDQLKSTRWKHLITTNRRIQQDKSLLHPATPEDSVQLPGWWQTLLQSARRVQECSCTIKVSPSFGEPLRERQGNKSNKQLCLVSFAGQCHREWHLIFSIPEGLKKIKKLILDSHLHSAHWNYSMYVHAKDQQITTNINDCCWVKLHGD